MEAYHRVNFNHVKQKDIDMSKGYWIVKGDKTSCGGQVLDGLENRTLADLPVAFHGGKTSCGKHPGVYPLVGGHPNLIFHGFHEASTLYSRSGCPCKARLKPSITEAWHTLSPEDIDKMVGRSVTAATPAPVAITAPPEQEPAQFAQTAKKSSQQATPEPMPIPALIYQTQNRMDDYQAKDMHHGDMDVLALRNGVHIDVDNVSARVNPWTLKRKPEPATGTLYSPYAMQDLEQQMPSVSRDESARMMFDEFRELAKLYSFHGPYKNIITGMIDHMQENSGTPYSSPLLDRALKEQILNDGSEQSSLLGIKKALDDAVSYEYGFIPLDKKDDLFDGKGNFKEVNKAVLPKFDRQIDKTNGLVITVHDTWATHITLESLEVEGDSYRAKVHYRIQDHFGLDDADVLNPVYREFRIFRLWFALQRWDLYGYKPFITEMNATVEISGRRGE